MMYLFYNPRAANASLVNCNIIISQKLMRLRVTFIHFYDFYPIRRIPSL
jgi:hypothetical protein